MYQGRAAAVSKAGSHWKKIALTAAGVSVGGMIALGIGTGAAIGFGISSARKRRSRRSIHSDVVLITGGSRGLGLLLAREFANRGCKIAICARDGQELQSARDSLERSGAEVFTAVCDVSDADQVRRMIEAVQERFGRIDTLINNAGVIRVAPIDNVTEADFKQAMDVMFWGVVHPTLAVLPEMTRRGTGRIATITSIGGKVSVPHLIPYCCAKHAAVAFCEGLRAELAGRGVSVTTIAPGLMRTGSYRKAEFKGQQAKEAAWFSLGATLPLISMDANRAARQIVRAIERGKSEKILSTQASLLARFQGLFPGAVPNLFGMVNRLMPASAGDRTSVISGASAEQNAGGVLRALTALGRSAARNTNQMAAEPS